MTARRHRRWLLVGVPAACTLALIVLPVVLIGGVAIVPPCAPPSVASRAFAGSGTWIATAYGPPWDALNGSGITATGLNLTSRAAGV